MQRSRRDTLQGRTAMAVAAMAVGALLGSAMELRSDTLRGDLSQDCFGEDNARRIPACTELLDTPLTPGERSFAYAMRALAYSLLGDYERAIPDYDAALAISPDFAVALNNRAWAYYKAGRPSEGWPDITRALELNPASPHALDTRAHIRQAEGDVDGALADYDMAMRLGGTRIVRLYQCGLQANGLFDGFLDGIMSEKLRGAFETCVRQTTCDPLPADEECRKLTS
ncbi:MAG: tetratricopeptide repeat protein [Hyphomicrobiaceae bacterium]|nr:tetratricopeptide repeat protein [Hyphomicrobiaceae bacterium]